MLLQQRKYFEPENFSTDIVFWEQNLYVVFSLKIKDWDSVVSRKFGYEEMKKI
jgi:hypothetical protein